MTPNSQSPALRRTVDVTALIEGRRLTRFNYGVIVLSWLITVFDGFDMMMISFTAPYMRDEMGLSKAQLGHVFSAGLAGMMIGGFVFSYLADRIGRRPTILISASAFGILTAGTALAQGPLSLMALRFADGLAIGGMLPLAWALNIEFVPKRLRSTVVTVIMMGYSAGTTIAGPMTVALAPTYGWRIVFLLGGAGTVLCVIALALWLPESVRFLVSRGLHPGTVAGTLRRMQPDQDFSSSDAFVLTDEPTATTGFRVGQLFAGRLAIITPLLWLAYIASSLAIYFGASWGPIVYEELTIPRNTAALAASAASATGAIAGLLLMRFTDAKGPISVAFYPMLAIPLGLFLGFVPLGQAAFIALAVLSATMISGGHFGVLSIAGIFYPSAIRANGAGWATSIAKFGAIAGPIVGAAVLSSGIPVIRCYAIIAICPLVVMLCALGIAAASRGGDRREASAATA